MSEDVWSDVVGETAPRVTVIERPDKSMTTWLRWYLGGKPKYAMTRVRSVRDERGRLLRRKQQAALAEALEKYRQLHGMDAPRPKAGPLTFLDGVDRAFSVTGRYPLDPKKDRHTRDFKELLEQGRQIMQPLAIAAREPSDGRDQMLYWDEVGPGLIRSLWRTIRKRYPGGTGYRKAEKMVAAVFSVSAWLAEEFPEQHFPRPMRHWRTELKEYWRKTGDPVDPKQPRHTEEEIALILRGRRLGDPRVALAVVIGPELRGGQLVKVMRTDYDRDGGTQLKRGAMGSVRVPYVSSRKRAPLVYLNWRERLELERALRRGYLSDLEAAYQADEIDDYPLFPGGELRAGKAVVARADQLMHPSTLIKMFHALERAVGVEPEKDRGWHGMRRRLSDVYEPHTGDERVKDQAGGWTKGSGMRRKVYQQGEDPKVLSDTARLRRDHRPGGKSQ